MYYGDMSRTVQLPRGSYEKAKELSTEVKRASELRRLQSVMLGSQGLIAVDIALVVGLSVSRIRQVWMQCRRHGVESLVGEKRGKGRPRAHMSSEEEKIFLASFGEGCKKGKWVTANTIHQTHQKVLGKPIKKSVTYRLLKRHRWRKIEPRPEHPKHDPKKMKHFKEVIFPPDYDPYED